MKAIVFTMAIMLSYCTVNGHHIIKGIVINAEDNSPLIGAAIQLVGESNGTITDGFGQFELIMEGSEATIRISYVGFNDKTLVVDEHDGPIRILLEPSPVSVWLSVDVEAKSGAPTLEDAIPCSTSMYSPDELSPINVSFIKSPEP